MSCHPNSVQQFQIPFNSVRFRSLPFGSVRRCLGWPTREDFAFCQEACGFHANHTKSHQTHRKRIAQALQCTKHLRASPRLSFCQLSGLSKFSKRETVSSCFPTTQELHIHSRVPNGARKRMRTCTRAAFSLDCALGHVTMWP